MKIIPKGHKMITKWIRKPVVFFLFVFTISVVFPIAGGILIALSPGSAGLAYFPVLSARCFGEFIGGIGFLFGVPGLVTSFIIVYLVSSIILYLASLSIEAFNNIFPPDFQLLTIGILGLILNFAIYFFVFRALLKPIKNTQEESPKE